MKAIIKAEIIVGALLLYTLAYGEPPINSEGKENVATKTKIATVQTAERDSSSSTNFYEQALMQLSETFNNSNDNEFVESQSSQEINVSDNYSSCYSQKLGREVIEYELYLLNMITYMESGNQPYEGQVAVAATVLNRLQEGGEFGDCLWNVIFKPGAFSPAKSDHFENSNGEVVTEVSDSLKDQISQAVLDALAGVDPTNGALYFYNPKYCSAYENSIRENRIHGVTIIGDHIFYREWY